MEASALLRLSSSSHSPIIPPSSYSNPKYTTSYLRSFSSSIPNYSIAKCRRMIFNFLPQKNSGLLPFPRTSLLRTSALAVGEILEKSSTEDSVSVPREVLPKIDKSGRFCSPRAARELALSIIYAACLEGSDPLRLFEKRVNARREVGYEFDKASLMEYNHMSFGGPPVTADTVEEADELLSSDEKASQIEAEVLSAPPKLVYSKLILRFSRKLLVAVVEKWDTHAVVIEKVVPLNWKNQPAGRILELSILHLAMSEMAVLGTRHQIVINEAIDLAKRFCDGAAPRVINGCLRTFVRDLEGTRVTEDLKTKANSFG